LPCESGPQEAFSEMKKILSDDATASEDQPA